MYLNQILVKAVCGHDSAWQDSTALVFLSATKLGFPRQDSTVGITHTMDIALAAWDSQIVE